MKKTNRLSLMRLTYAILIMLTFIVGTIALCYFSSTLLDQIICLIAVNITFIIIFLLMIIRKRLLDLLPENIYMSYGRLLFSIFICFLITIGCALFAPDFFAPVMLIPLILSAILDDGSNIALSIYYVVILSIAQNFSMYEIISYLILITFGVMISSFIIDNSLIEKLYASIIIFASNILVSIVFYYFSYLEITSTIFLYCIIDTIIVLLFSVLITPLLHKSVQNTQIDIYDLLLDPNYVLCEDIRKFSFIEYQHANRVSRLAGLCAREIGANEQLATCGGFYYRLGKIEGEPMIDNAIRIANDHCFPEELISLMKEYGGIISLPTTVESAIVHMVDSIVTKIECFDPNQMQSNWNQNMVIYQTINELSQKGFYDKSGLTMNQFLSIREKLANEDILS